MKQNTLTVKYLESLGACKEGIEFVKRNGLEGLSLDLLDKIEGDVSGRFVSWLKEAKKPKFEYDSQGNKTKKTNPNGDVWTWEYDNQGNMTKETYPNGSIYSYEYDSQGNMTKMTGPSGRVLTWEYDSQGNKTKETYLNGRVRTWEYVNTKEKLVIKEDGSIKCIIYKK